MDARNVQGLTRVLLYGSKESRTRVARELTENNALETLAMLVSTVRSNESLLLRARCLEALGHVAAVGGRATAERVLHELFPECGDARDPAG